MLAGNPKRGRHDDLEYHVVPLPCTYVPLGSESQAVRMESKSKRQKEMTHRQARQEGEGVRLKFGRGSRSERGDIGAETDRGGSVPQPATRAVRVARSGVR